MKRFEAIEDLEAFMDAHKDQQFFVFKRSTRCPVSAMAFEEFKRFVKNHPDLISGYIDVIESRDVSNHLAEISGVTHKSPQVLQYYKGDVLWHDSHHAITEESLKGQIKS